MAHGGDWPKLRASRYWEHKTLEQMSEAEWEALCDGCGKCCLHKLIDDDTDELYHTNIACRLLDTDSVRCRDYHNRHSQVPDCLEFTVANVAEQTWLPKSCAYRTLHEGRKLQKWHPLISGRHETVHQFKRSIRGRCVSENEIDPDHWDEHLIHWV
jgi:uncharacterized cysteine cluster protein YcgN (CxxCxxCC family)